MRAIALISGGLDSILAAKLVQSLGVEIIPVHFKIPFLHRGKNRYSPSIGKISNLHEILGRKIEVVDIGEDFLVMLVNPHYGFGSNMNPCIDCKIVMFKKVKELMKDLGVSFVVTGEVLGQRPMSQHKQALGIVARRSGLDGLILRPLSARLLPETIPEKESWVSRSKLLGFNGRGRRPQIDLAKSLGIDNFSQPAGGCLLTEKEFSRKLEDLIRSGQMDLDNVELLKIGRHFRITTGSKLIVGRDERENQQLVRLARPGDYLFYPDENMAGPTALGRGEFNLDLIKLSSSIVCRYCDIAGATEAKILYNRATDDRKESIIVAPEQESTLNQIRL